MIGAMTTVSGVPSHFVMLKGTVATETMPLSPSLILLGGASKWAAREGVSALYVNWKDNYLNHHLTDGSTWGPWPNLTEMDDWRFAILCTLTQYGFNVECSGDIPADLSTYDLVVIHAYWAVEPRHAQLIRNYVLGGGGVIIISGVPPYFIDYEKDWWTTTDLTSIHEWFGSSCYVNVGGSATVSVDNPFGTGLSSGDFLCSNMGYSNAGVSYLDSDVQVIASWIFGNPYAFAHEFGQGRVYYQSRFENIPPSPPEHEINVNLEAPVSMKPNDVFLLSGTVYNTGLNNETNIDIQLVVNGVTVAATTVTELLIGASYSLNYLWIPPTEGQYNVTFHASPVTGEGCVDNNIATKLVDVHNLPEGTVICVNPQVSSALIGKTIDVGVTIRNVNNLYGYEFKLFYNRAVLNCTNIMLPPNHFISPQDPNFLLTIKFKFDNEYNETHGLVWVALSLLYPELPRTGNGELVTVTFQTMTIGESFLELYDTKLADSGGHPITHTVVDSNIKVEETLGVLMLADINFDRLIDIFDIVFVAAAFSSKPGDTNWNSRANLNQDEIVDVYDLVMTTSNYGRSY